MTGIQITPKFGLTVDTIFIQRWGYAPTSTSVGVNNGSGGVGGTMTTPASSCSTTNGVYSCSGSSALDPQRYRLSVYFLASAAILYTVIALQLVPRYGTVGAALSGVITICMYAPIVSTYVQRQLKIRMYDFKLLKPLAAIVLALTVAFGVSLALPAVGPDESRHLLRILRAALIGGSTLAVYLFALLKMGIEAEERELLRSAGGPLGKIRRKLAKLKR